MGSVVRLEDNAPAVKRPPGLPASTSDETLTDAVRLHLLGAPDAVVAAKLGIEPQLLEFWLSSNFWGEQVVACLPQTQALLKGRLTRTVALAIDQIEDRLRNGDIIYTRDGVEKDNRCKLSATDLASVGSRLAEIQRGMDRVDTDKSPNDERMDLNDLARALRHAARQPIDVTPTKATK